MENGFVKNVKVLEEDYRVDDLLDFSVITSDFRKTLENINTNAVIGLVGEFGSGKSTMLYQLYKEQRDDNNEKWLNFDAWKYPERKDLWEGFVLEITRQLDISLFEEARKKIDGKEQENIRTFIKVLFEGANLFVPGVAIGKSSRVFSEAHLQGESLSFRKFLVKSSKK